MSGTNTTLTNLYAQFPTGGPTGGILPLNGRNIVATLGARTAIPLVTNAEFGADPTGTVDSTAAWMAAMAASRVIIVPPGIFKLNNCVVPNGTSILGFSPVDYQTGTSTATQPYIMAATAGTTNIFNVDNAFDITMQGLHIDGSNGTLCNAISGNSTRLTLRDCTISGCTNYGLGGVVPGGSGILVSYQARLYNVTFVVNVIAMGDQIDSLMVGGSMSGGGSGWLSTAQMSGYMAFCAVRIEWNSYYGVVVTPATYAQNLGVKVQFTGCQFDRNYITGAYLNGASQVCFTGCSFTRNGRNLDSNSCHVLFNNASHIIINGCTSNYGQDDNATGNISPAVWARFNGTNYDINIADNDLTGYTASQTGTGWYAGALPALQFTSKYNMGAGFSAQDVDNRTPNMLTVDFLGGTAGTPGTGPTNVTFSGGTGLTQTLSFGTDAGTGLPYMQVQLAGTTSGAGFYYIQLYTGSYLPVVASTQYNFTVYAALTGGALTNFTMALAAFTYVAGVWTAQITGSNFAPNATLAQFSYAPTMGSTINGIFPFIQIAYTGAVAIATTLRFVLPQWMPYGFGNQNTQSITANGQMISVPVAATSVVLTTTTAANMTGMILAAGVAPGQVFTIINESAYTITFAAAAASNVYGTPTQIAQVSQDYVWDAINGLWRQKA